MADQTGAPAHPAASIFPPARLRVTTPRLELRLPTDEELVAMCEVAARGVHDPHDMPFAMPWTDAPGDEVARNAYTWHMQCRGSWKPSDWYLLLGVFVEGAIVGIQDIAATEFATRREIGSASWIGLEFQGRGIGTEMREAMLHLGFDGLGALAANSGAYDDNVASNRVSRKAGYEPNGVRAIARRRGAAAPGGDGVERVMETRYRLERDAWLERRRDDIEVHGLDEQVLAAFGATPVR